MQTHAHIHTYTRSQFRRARRAEIEIQRFNFFTGIDLSMIVRFSESIGVIPKFLHGIDRGNSHFSAPMRDINDYGSRRFLLECAMSAYVHNAQMLRFMPTGVVGMRMRLLRE